MQTSNATGSFSSLSSDHISDIKKSVIKMASEVPKQSDAVVKASQIQCLV